MTAAEAQKLCSGLCLRTDAVIQKTHSMLTATTTAVTDTVAPGLIYRRTTSQLRMKKNQQNQQPPLPQSSTTFVCIRQALFQKYGASRRAEAALRENPACPRCAAALLTHSRRGAPAQRPAHCQSLCTPPVQGEKVWGEKVCLGLS